jgi:DNA-binding MarR family transcriptional regulator
LKTSAVTNQNADILRLLSDVARLMRTEADRRARIHGITRAQWVILDRVKEAPGLTQRQLAEFLEVEPITVGRLVDRLEIRGVVERRPDPQDRRVWRLHLRPAAATILAKLDVQRVAIRDLVVEGIEADPLDAAQDVLRRIKLNLLTHRRALQDQEGGELADDLS